MTKGKKEDARQLAFPTSDAQVHERQITIRVLTIGTKQVTQTLFRQLVDDERVIDPETGLINGPVWGWVNLHVDCDEVQDKKVEHLHVIWEDAGILKRAVVRVTGYHTVRATLLDKQLRVAARVCYYASGLERIAVVPSQDDHAYDDKKVTCKNRIITFSAYHSVRDYLNNFKNIEEAKQQLAIAESNSQTFEVIEARETLKRLNTALQNRRREIMDQLTTSWEALAGNGVPLPTAEEAWKVLEEIVDEIRAFEQAWKKSYAYIKEQGQLFIAVSGVWK